MAIRSSQHQIRRVRVAVLLLLAGLPGCHDTQVYVGAACSTDVQCRSPLTCQEGVCALATSGHSSAGGGSASGGTADSSQPSGSGGTLSTVSTQSTTSSVYPGGPATGGQCTGGTAGGVGTGGFATGGQYTGGTPGGGVGTGGFATGGQYTGGTATGGIGTGGASSSAPGLKANGAACTAGTDCQSTYCVDRVCCESTCSGQCETCNDGNDPGKCTRLMQGQPVFGRSPCKNPGSVCGGSCTGSASCTYADLQTQCDSNTDCIDASTKRLGTTCDGSGSCSIPITTTCEPPTVCNVNTDRDCGLPKYTHVTVNESNSCAVVSDGTLRCWGSNDWGQLGTTRNIVASAPQRVTGKSNVRAVATGWAQTCVLLRDGSVNCWGADYNGNTGCPNPTMTFDPIDCATLPASAQIVELIAGAEDNCALTSAGRMKCWGRNDFGSMGIGISGRIGVNPNVYSPVDVESISTAVHMAAGAWHTCAALANGNVMCWGGNDYGQLGVGDQNLRTVPMPTIGIDGQKSGAIKIAASSEHTCALLSDGTVVCTGDNAFGELGTSTTATTSSVFVPTQPPISGIDLALGSGLTCVLTNPTTASCWGDGSRGSLGNGAFDSSATPVSVRMPTGIEFQSITSKSLHVCALSTEGRIWCWGANASGQLGNGTTADSAVPVEVQPATLN